MEAADDERERGERIEQRAEQEDKEIRTYGQKVCCEEQGNDGVDGKLDDRGDGDARRGKDKQCTEDE